MFVIALFLLTNTCKYPFKSSVKKPKVQQRHQSLEDSFSVNGGNISSCINFKHQFYLLEFSKGEMLYKGAMMVLNRWSVIMLKLPCGVFFFSDSAGTLKPPVVH